MRIEVLSEGMILTPDQFADLYFDKLNLLNKFAWMTIPPRILWKKVNQYSEAFTLMDKIFSDNGIEDDIDYHISDAYQRLSNRDKNRIIDILNKLEEIDYFKEKRNKEENKEN